MVWENSSGVKMPMSKSGTFTLRSWLGAMGGGVWVGGVNPMVSRCSTTGYKPAPLPGCDVVGCGFRWCVSVTPRFEEIARTIDVIAGKLWPL
jgi:hypothetical protein